MATVRRIGKTWHVEVRIKGKSARKSFPTKIEAQSWGIEKEKEFHRGNDIIHGKTVGDAFDRYAREVTPSKKGARWETIRLEKLQRSRLADIQMNILCPDDIRQWMTAAGETLSPASVLRELQIISAVCERARQEWHWLERNPCKEVRKPKKPPPRDRRISQSEIDQILLALQYDEKDPVVNNRQGIAVAFLFSLETAMRQGEIWGMTWENIHIDQKFVTLPDTKNGYKRDVPLSTRAIELIEKMRGGDDTGRVFKSNQDSCGAMFRRSLKLAEIKDLTFHDARHEACTRLARKLDMLDLARMIGHRDPRSLMIYYNPTASEIADRLG